MKWIKIFYLPILTTELWFLALYVSSSQQGKVVVLFLAYIMLCLLMSVKPKHLAGGKELLFIWRKAYKGPGCEQLGLVGQTSLLQPLNSATVASKQPQTTREKVGVASFP